jgi:hypothetical protein
MLKGSCPQRRENRREIETCKARKAFAVGGSLIADGAGAKRRAAPWQSTNLLTIQVREAQTIDRLYKEREAPFTD